MYNKLCDIMNHRKCLSVGRLILIGTVSIMKVYMASRSHCRDGLGMPRSPTFISITLSNTLESYSLYCISNFIPVTLYLPYYTLLKCNILLFAYLLSHVIESVISQRMKE